MTLGEIYRAIDDDPANAQHHQQGFKPLYTAKETSKIVIVGQAPGSKAQASNTPWDDASGDALRQWLGVSREQFYNPDLFALVPMDFYYPGKGTHGDLPPRKDFAPHWHPLILEQMQDVKLILLVGGYAQAYYLGNTQKRNLTETVRAYREYLPRFFPLVHPSPLNFRWRAKNPWFEQEVVPALTQRIAKILN